MDYTAICPGSPPCSGHGECISSSGIPQCSCFLYYNGTDCSIENIPCPNVCLNNGTCNYSIGACHCTSEWTGFNCSISIHSLNVTTGSNNFPTSSTSSDSSSGSSSSGSSEDFFVSFYFYGGIAMVGFLAIILGVGLIVYCKKKMQRFNTL